MSSMPWLSARKKNVTVMDASPEGALEHESMEVSEEEIMAAEDVFSAIAMKDAAALARAMKALFMMADAEPHVEGPHVEIDR